LQAELIGSKRLLKPTKERSVGSSTTKEETEMVTSLLVEKEDRGAILSSGSVKKELQEVFIG